MSPFHSLMLIINLNHLFNRQNCKKCFFLINNYYYFLFIWISREFENNKEMSLKRRIPFVSLKRRIRESFLKTSLVSPRTSISLDTPLASLFYSFFLHFLPSFFPISYAFSHLLFLFPYHSHLLFLFSFTFPFPLSLPFIIPFLIYFSFSPITPIYYSYSHLLFLFPIHSPFLFQFKTLCTYCPPAPPNPFLFQFPCPFLL